jgi:hypothetical protein
MATTGGRLDPPDGNVPPPLVPPHERGNSRGIMATEGSFGLTASSTYEIPLGNLVAGSPGSGLLHTIGSWVLARVVDGGREATFSLEADERFARVRRVHGATASMLECKLPSPMTAAEIAQSLVRWAPSQSMTARVQPEAAGAVRVTLSLPTD